MVRFGFPTQHSYSDILPYVGVPSWGLPMILYSVTTSTTESILSLICLSAGGLIYLESFELVG